jgi:PAS domain-containing protein
MEAARSRMELIPKREQARGPQRPAATAASSEQAVGHLLEAFGLLARRGIGSLAWSTPYDQDPIAFLLDAVTDAMNVWGPNGQIVFRNRAAIRLDAGSCSDASLLSFVDRGRRFERRCTRCGFQGVEYVLEVIREVWPLDKESSDRVHG